MRESSDCIMIHHIFQKQLLYTRMSLKSELCLADQSEELLVLLTPATELSLVNPPVPVLQDYSQWLSHLSLPTGSFTIILRKLSSSGLSGLFLLNFRVDPMIWSVHTYVRLFVLGRLVKHPVQPNVMSPHQTAWISPLPWPHRPPWICPPPHTGSQWSDSAPRRQ